MELCRPALLEVDTPCAEALLASMDWSPGRYFCNDWECGCAEEERISFFGPGLKEAEAACGATVAHQRCLRENSPTPPSIGPAPSSVVSLGDAGVLEFELVGDNRMFGLGEAQDGTGFWGRWSLDGRAQSTYPDRGLHTYGRDNLVRVRTDRVATLEQNVVAIEADQQGNVFVASTEAPYPSEHASTDVCTVYGCEGVALRKLSANGTLLLEYQRRNVTSEALDLALDVSDRPFVLGA